MNTTNKSVFLCAICNASSGSCSEDCKFCTQSIHNDATVEQYREKGIETILREAEMAKQNRASGFCLVTAGQKLDEPKLDYINKAARAVKESFPNFHLIACCGIADVDSLKVLKDAGVDSYNHNLESARSFYPHICSTMEWDARFQTCLNAKEVGLQLCTGGIFGLGETHEQRLEMIKSLQELSPMSTPLNFFHPNPSLPLSSEALDTDSALEIISLVRKSLPQTRLMVAGGRDVTFKNRQNEIFERGIDAIVVGNYLTTKGRTPKEDIEMVESMGYEIIEACA